MIELAKERLPVEQEKKLRRWMSLPEANILRRVVSAKCQFNQAEALGKALVAGKGDANDLLLQDDMREAARYSSFLDIFDSLADQEQFHTAKLKPAITHANTITSQDTGSDSD